MPIVGGSCTATADFDNHAFREGAPCVKMILEMSTSSGNICIIARIVVACAICSRRLKELVQDSEIDFTTRPLFYFIIGSLDSSR